jgi:Viral BACON domain
MSRRAYSIAGCLAVLLFPRACFAQDTVPAYAAFCYGQLGVTAGDMETAFGGTSRECYYGKKLTTYHNGIELDPANLVTGMKNFLKTCDAPAWLGSGLADRQCYDASYIKALTFTNADVKGALLCRHKTRDPALYPDGVTPKHNDFDDIAMILFNENTGKACWFQTQEGPGATNDGKVPVPHNDTAGFWLKPSDTAKKYCARCHDNGPWMNSQWLYSQFSELEDGKGKYETPVYTSAFGDWPKTDDFVEIGRTGLAGTGLPECTSCHKLSAKIKWPGGSNNGTYNLWFAYSTGQKMPTQATASEPGRPVPADYIYTHWMPTSRRRPPDAATYDTVYKTHLTELKTCMATPRASRTAPCTNTRTAMLNPTPAPAGTGALVSATVVGTGTSFSATAAPLDTAAAPVTQVIAAGQTLQLAWQADATFKACSIVATMPPGVLVPVISGSSRSMIGSGASWELPDAPPVVGPLTEPGIYDFSIYCRDTYTGSLQFQVGTQGPNSLVKLVTLVNGTVQATAIHSNSLMQPATTTNAMSTDSVELTWVAYNVRPSSCTLSGPGVTSTDEVGSQAIAFSGSTDQVYTFQCVGANDGVSRSVSSTIHPGNPPPTSDSVSPNAGSGSSQTFSLAYSDSNGYTDLASVSVLFGDSLAASNTCEVRYDRPANALYLTGDNAAALGPLTPGSTSTLENSQCVVNGIGSSANGSGNTLTLNVALTFKPAFAGQKTIFMNAKNSAGGERGYQNLGTWTVPSGCSYSISPTTASVGSGLVTGSVSVTAPAGCSWTATSNAGWISITSGASGGGNGTVAYSAQANTGSARTGTLAIAGATFTLTQQAASNLPLTATLSTSTPPSGSPGPISPLADLNITISGGTAGQRMTVNVAVFLTAGVAAVPDTAQLTDASGRTIAGIKTGNAYTFLNVQFDQPGSAGTKVYTITNMKANTAWIPVPPGGSVPVLAFVAIFGGVPLALNNPIQTVAFIK